MARCLVISKFKNLISISIHIHEHTVEATFGKIYAYNVLSWSRGHCHTGEEKEIINISSYSFLSFSSLTSDDGVVEEHEDDEGAVEDGERDQQLVERVRHLLVERRLIQVLI